MNRREYIIILLVALAITVALYGAIGLRSARILRTTCLELKAVQPHLEAIVQAGVPARAEVVDQALAHQAPHFKAVLPVLSRAEKRLGTRGLRDTDLYDAVSKMLWGMMDFNRLRARRDAGWVLVKLTEIHDDAVAVRAQCN